MSVLKQLVIQKFDLNRGTHLVSFLYMVRFCLTDYKTPKAYFLTLIPVMITSRQLSSLRLSISISKCLHTFPKDRSHRLMRGGMSPLPISPK